MSTYLVAFGILLVAAFAQALSGFGYALIAVPLLAATVDPQLAVVAATLVSLAMTAVTTIADRAHVSGRAAALLSLASLVGMPAGLLTLRLLPAAALTLTIAIVTLACTALVWRGWHFAPTPPRIASAGALSGLLLTSTGTNGPPLVAVLQAMGLEPVRFRATLAAVFTASGVLGAVGFAVSGLVTARSLVIVVIGLAAAVLGGWAGRRLAAGIDATRFRRLVLGALVLSSSVAFARAAGLL